MQLHESLQRAYRAFVVRRDRLRVDEVDVAFADIDLKWIRVLVQYSALTISKLHLLRNGGAYVTVMASVCALLLHALEVESFGVLYDFLGLSLVLLK